MPNKRILRQRYKIIERIGGGGFGDTYLALDLDFPGERQCVVKHLSPKNSDPEAVAIAKRLFEDEAKCLSLLGEHDHIPRLYSYFEEDGQFYLVQEFIKGQNLASEFQTGKRWNEEETVNFLQELLEILTFVHQQTPPVIHRDIKPANIMRGDRDGKLVLIDFGAVKEKLTVDKHEQTDLTISIGTPPYMAPEQGMGRPEQCSDIYAVGILGIQALAGLTSKDLLKDLDKLKQILDKLPINPQLKYVLNRMVSFQYKNRFADASEALQALVPTDIVHPPQESVSIDVESSRTTSNFLKKLLLTLFSAIALIGAGVYAVRSFTKTPQPNYAQLETYLQNKQWQQADEASNRILLEITGEDSGLNAKSIANISCDSLSTIDKLWTDNSNGRFGFSPQKQVYLETGNQIGQYTESTYQAFGDKVGWRTFGYWSLYGDLKFTDIAPVGHLPSPGTFTSDEQNLRLRERGMLLSRVDECGF